MTGLDNLNHANVAAGRVNDYLIREGVTDRVEYTSSVGGTLNYELKFKGHSESFSVTKRFFDEFKENGFIITSEYINWYDKEFVIRLQWLPRYVRPQTDIEKEAARRMAEAMYDAVMLGKKIDKMVKYIGAVNEKYHFEITLHGTVHEENEMSANMSYLSNNIIDRHEFLDEIKHGGFELTDIDVNWQSRTIILNLIWVGIIDE